MIGQLTPADALAEAKAAVAYLRANPASNGKVGAIGFCWGGGVGEPARRQRSRPRRRRCLLRHAGRRPADVPKIKAKLMLHYAGLDERINAGIKEYEAALKAAGVDYQLYVHEGANHAFNNDTSSARYDEKAATPRLEPHRRPSSRPASPEYRLPRPHLS